jgi:DNA-directed RNA polymerase specialized sigma subunit
VEEQQTLSLDEANELVLEHRGWAESIARSVARSWDLDWQSDGLDGAAMEALIFCSRRFTPGRGVPFRGYARRRIHEASTEAARKSKGWAKRTNAKISGEARELSNKLLDVFSDLRSGEIRGDSSAENDGESLRSGVRELLVGAALIAAGQTSPDAQPDELTDFKKMVSEVADLEPVHQEILWKLYWDDLSMRGLATLWETDELNVIREHQAILQHLARGFNPGNKTKKALKVRPGLKDISIRYSKDFGSGAFARAMQGEQ